MPAEPNVDRVIRVRRPLGATDPGASDGVAAPLVLLFHGRGGNEDEIHSLAEAAPTEALVVSLRAPLVEAGGYSWSERFAVGRLVPASLRATLDWFWPWFDSLIAGDSLGRIDAARVTAVGFSSGAMMAAAVALDHPSAITAVAALHGPVPFDAGLDLSPGRLAGHPVLLSWDPRDPVIPVALMERSRDWLSQQSGALLRTATDDAGHAISPRLLRTLAEFLSTATPATSRSAPAQSGAIAHPQQGAPHVDEHAPE